MPARRGQQRLAVLPSDTAYPLPLATARQREHHHGARSLNIYNPVNFLSTLLTPCDNHGADIIRLAILTGHDRGRRLRGQSPRRRTRSTLGQDCVYQSAKRWGELPVRTMWLAASALAAAISIASAPLAQADVAPAGNSYTFDFSGQCLDCTGYGSGVLQVQDYVLGSALADANLVDFSYSSNLTSFDINPANDSLLLDTLSGSINTAQGFYDVHVESSFLGLILVSSFDSFTDGAWSASTPVPADFGLNGTWNASAVSAAPEPSTWLLMFAGIGGIGLMLRQAKRTVSFRPKDALSA